MFHMSLSIVCTKGSDLLVSWRLLQHPCRIYPLLLFKHLSWLFGCSFHPLICRLRYHFSCHQRLQQQQLCEQPRVDRFSFEQIMRNTFHLYEEVSPDTMENLESDKESVENIVGREELNVSCSVIQGGVEDVARVYSTPECVDYTGWSKKVWLAIGIRSGLRTKVGWVLKNSGFFLSNKHKTLHFCE